MDVRQLRDALVRIAATRPTSFPGAEHLRQIAEHKLRRRRWAYTITCGIVGIAVATTVFAALIESPNHPSAVQHSFNLGPGCGDEVSINPAGAGAVENVRASSINGFRITGVLSFDTHSVSIVTQVQIIVGTPNSIPGIFAPSPSPPPGAISDPVNQLVTKTFNTGLTSGATLTLDGPSLAAGSYPVYGLVSFVNTKMCGGHANQEINRFGTIAAS